MSSEVTWTVGSPNGSFYYYTQDFTSDQTDSGTIQLSEANYNPSEAPGNGTAEAVDERPAYYYNGSYKASPLHEWSGNSVSWSGYNVTKGTTTTNFPNFTFDEVDMTQGSNPLASPTYSGSTITDHWKHCGTWGS